MTNYKPLHDMPQQRHMSERDWLYVQVVGAMAVLGICWVAFCVAAYFAGGA
jgi:hypothetical protein